MRRPTSSSTSPSKLSFLRASTEGVLISIRLQPRSSRNKVEGASEGALRIRLTAPPVEGEANRALIEFLSSLTGFKKSALSIASGQKSRDKTVLAAGATLAEVEAALEGEAG